MKLLTPTNLQANCLKIQDIGSLIDALKSEFINRPDHYVNLNKGFQALRLPSERDYARFFYLSIAIPCLQIGFLSTNNLESKRLRNTPNFADPNNLLFASWYLHYRNLNTHDAKVRCAQSRQTNEEKLQVYAHTPRSASDPFDCQDFYYFPRIANGKDICEPNNTLSRQFINALGVNPRAVPSPDVTPRRLAHFNATAFAQLTQRYGCDFSKIEF